MSDNFQGGINYALVKRHYDADDYPTLTAQGVVVLDGIPFTNTPTFYLSGLCAFLNDPSVFDTAPKYGWTLYAHGQTTAPAYLQALLVAAKIDWMNLVSAYPGTVPVFEAKDTVFWSDQDCYIQFGGASRVRHLLPANTYMRTQRRWFMIWVTRAGADDGTLRAWING